MHLIATLNVMNPVPAMMIGMKFAAIMIRTAITAIQRRDHVEVLKVACRVPEQEERQRPHRRRSGIRMPTACDPFDLGAVDLVVV